MRTHLSAGGIVALNVAATPHDRRLTEAVDTTLAAVFPEVWWISELRFGDLLILQRPLPRGALARRIARVPSELWPLLPRVERGLARLTPQGDTLERRPGPDRATWSSTSSSYTPPRRDHRKASLTCPS